MSKMIKSGLSVNPQTGGVCFTDETLHNVYDGTAFAFTNYYTLGKNKSKHILIRRPGPEYSIMIGVFAIAKYDAFMKIYASPTVNEWGDQPTEPLPLPRNTDPRKFRLPFLQIWQDGDYEGGIHTGSTRIESDMKDSSINYLERAVYAHSDGEGLYHLHFRNEYDGANVFNLFICWNEYLQ